MYRKHEKRMDINKEVQGGFTMDMKQQRNVDMNNEQKGEYTMNRVQTDRRNGYQDREPETAGPKDLRTAYSGEDRRARLMSSHGKPGALPEARADAETLENLDGMSGHFRAEIVDFNYEPGYQGRRVKKVLLTNVRMTTLGILLEDQVLNYGKWVQGLRVGDIIAFDATLIDGKLMRPRNANLLVRSGSKSKPREFPPSRTPQGPSGSAVQTEMSF